jgi:hypothetical protein
MKPIFLGLNSVSRDIQGPENKILVICAMPSSISCKPDAFMGTAEKGEKDEPSKIKAGGYVERG